MIIRRLFLTVFAIFAFVANALAVEPEKQDTTLYDHISIDQVGVAVRMPKQHYGLRQQPISSSVIGGELLKSERILSIKDLSAIAPNFYQPDYGSKMTSSIYVRGFGARIDQPIIGLTVDGVPYLNKNN